MLFCVFFSFLGWCQIDRETIAKWSQKNVEIVHQNDTLQNQHLQPWPVQNRNRYSGEIKTQLLTALLTCCSGFWIDRFHLSMKVSVPQLFFWYSLSSATRNVATCRVSKGAGGGSPVCMSMAKDSFLPQSCSVQIYVVGSVQFNLTVLYNHDA